MVLSFGGAGRAEERGFESSGKYDRSLVIELAMDPSVALVGQRTIGVNVSGPPVGEVKFFVDGVLAGADQSAPFNTVYDFGPTPRAHSLLIVAFTPEGRKNKRIFYTNEEGRLDPVVVTAPVESEEEAPAEDLPSPPTRWSPPAAVQGAEAATGRTAALSVMILEPWEDVVTGARTIVVDARARSPHTIARVEIFVDRRLVTTLTEAPWEAEYDFGPDPRPREVRAVAYTETEEAAAAVWKSEGAAPASEGAAPGELSVRFETPVDGDYLVGPVELKVDVTPSPGSPVTRVDFYVDDSLVGTAEEEPWRIEYDAGRRVLAHRVKAYAYDTDGRRAEAHVATLALDVGYTEEVREVVLTASFTDRTGRPVTDLTAEEIEVREDGAPQAVTGFRPERRPITLALVIDASGSMERKLSQTRLAAASFVDELSDEDRAMVIAFSAEPRIVQEPTSDKAALKGAISRITVETSTALYDAIHLAVERLEEADPDGRKALVVLSDGADSGGEGGSSRSYEEAEKLALLHDVRCYAIDITQSLPNLKALGGDGFDQVSSLVLQGLADQTGGEAYFVGSLIELNDVYGKVAEELRRQYWISYRPSNTEKDGKWRRIEIRGRDRKLIVKTRAGYYAEARS